jgi:hypothetical protein
VPGAALPHHSLAFDRSQTHPSAESTSKILCSARRSASMGFLRLVSLGLAVMTAAPVFAQLNNLDEAMRTTPITT